MLHPAVLVFACLAAGMVIAKVVVPQFRGLFVKFNMALPWDTRGFVAAGNDGGGAVAGTAPLVLLYTLWYIQAPVRRL